MTIYRKLALAAGSLTLAGIAFGLPVQAEIPKVEFGSEEIEALAAEAEAAAPMVEVDALEADLETAAEAAVEEATPDVVTEVTPDALEAEATIEEVDPEVTVEATTDTVDLAEEEPAVDVTTEEATEILEEALQPSTNVTPGS